MKKLLSLIFSAMMLFTIAFTVHSNALAKDNKDIVDIAVEDPKFSTLVKALTEADLVDTLKGDGPYTVFAPTNDAFKKLPDGKLEELLKPENKDVLKDILLYHVAAKELSSKDVINLIGKELEMANGKKAKIEIKDEELLIDGAVIKITDIDAKNGVIHVIDAVMIP